MSNVLWSQLKNGAGVRAQLARGAGASFIVQIASAVLGFGLHIVFARILDLDSYGRYSYAFSWATVLAFLARLGMPSSIVRFAGDYVGREAWGLLHGLLRHANTLVGLASGILVAFAAVAIRWTEIGDSVPWISISLIPLMSFSSIREGMLRALKRPGLSVAIDGLVRPAAALLVFVAFWLLGAESTSEFAMGAMVAGSAIALLVAQLGVVRFLPAGTTKAPAEFTDSRRWTSVALALFFMGGMSLIHNRADMIMLGLLRSSDEVALYAAASRYAAILLLPVQAVTGIAAPMIAEYHARSDFDRLKLLAGTSGLLILALTLPASIVFIAAGDWMLDLFGAGFDRAHPALTWLVVGQSVSAICGSVAVLMTMTNHQNAAAAMNGATAVLNLVLNSLLIPRYGATGAAIATATSLAVQHLLMLGFVLRFLQIDPTFYSVIARRVRRSAD